MTKLKLQDNAITGDGQRLFTIMAAEGNAFTVCLHDMHIDMNRTNNHSLVNATGDRYALQHCHAIGVYPADNAPATVLAYNLSFYDLIGDGLGLSGNSTRSYDTVTVHDIVSKGREGTRSDICLNGDFNSVTVYDCDLDSLETEVNRPAAGRKRRFSANNVVTRQRLDFGAKKDVEDGNRWEYTINNVVSSSDSEEAVWVCQSGLPWSREKPEPLSRLVCLCQPVVMCPCGPNSRLCKGVVCPFSGKTGKRARIKGRIVVKMKRFEKFRVKFS